MKLNKINLSGVSYDIEDLNASKTVELTQAQYDALAVKDPNTFYIITDAEPVDMSDYYTKDEVDDEITAATSGKQDTLVSGTNIKTVNNESLLGEGNIEIQGGGATYSAGTNISIDTANTINCTLNLRNGTGNNSIAGVQGETKGNYNFAFGNGSTAGTRSSDNYAFVFGGVCKARKGRSFAFGYNVDVKEIDSAAFGQNITLNAPRSFSTGYHNTTNNWTNIALGEELTTNNRPEFATGAYNNSVNGSTNADKTLFSVGNGTAANAKHNAFEIRQNGDIYISKDGVDVKLQDQLGGTVDTELDSTSENPVQNKVIYQKFDEVEEVTAAALNALNDKIGDINTLLEGI